MTQIILIVKTELSQLLIEKKVISAMIIFMIMVFVFVLSNISIEYEKRTNSEFNIQAMRDDILNVEFDLFLFIFCVLCYAMPILIVSDITAGEKERNTFESLLMTNCPRCIILNAKFLVTLLFSYVPFIIGFIFFMIINNILPIQIKTNYDMFRIFLLISPYSIVISLLLLYNGLKNKTVKSAKSQEQIYLILIPLFCIMLSMIEKPVSIMIYYIFMGLFGWFLYKKASNYIYSESIIIEK